MRPKGAPAPVVQWRRFLFRYVTFQRAHEAKDSPATNYRRQRSWDKKGTAESWLLLLRSRDTHGHHLQLLPTQAMSPMRADNGLW